MFERIFGCTDRLTNYKLLMGWDGMGNYRFVFNVACATDIEIARNTTQIARFDRVIEK